MAAVVNLAIAIGGLGVSVALTIAGFALYERVRGHGTGPDEEANDQRSAVPRSPRSSETREWRAALWGASAGLTIATRTWRSPGFRIVGLRRVDARTGGSVTVRSALLGVFYDHAFQTATRALFGSRARRERDRIVALEPQLQAIERDYAGDEQGRHRALMQLFKRSDVTPFGGCGLLLAGPVISQVALALGARGGRTIRDRVTGTQVIVDG